MARVLIIDDEQAILSGFRRFLAGDGVVIDTAEKMEEAENFLKSHQYDVVITDLRLTGMLGEEGLEILKYIKEFKPDTKCILMTGYGSPEIMTKAYDLGADFYFEKPVTPDVIKSALATFGITL